MTAGVHTTLLCNCAETWPDYKSKQDFIFAYFRSTKKVCSVHTGKDTCLACQKIILLFWIESHDSGLACELWHMKDGYRHAVPLAAALAEVTSEIPPVTLHIYWSFPGNRSITCYHLRHPATLTGSKCWILHIAYWHSGEAAKQLQMFLCIPGYQSDPHFLSGSAALPLQLYKHLRSSENLTEWSIPDCTTGCPCTAHFSDFKITFSHSSLFLLSEIFSQLTVYNSTSFYCSLDFAMSNEKSWWYYYHCICGASAWDCITQRRSCFGISLQKGMLLGWAHMCSMSSADSLQPNCCKRPHRCSWPAPWTCLSVLRYVKFCHHSLLAGIDVSAAAWDSLHALGF